MRGYCTLIGFVMFHGLGAQPVQVQQRHPDRTQSSPFSVDFFAANSPRGWAMTAEITGTAELDGDVLRLFIKTCSLSHPERFSDPINLVSIVSGISRVRRGDTWEILRRSERHLIRQSLAPGKRIDLQPFELTIPLQEFAIEEGDRLTFQISNISERDGGKHGGYVPVHARIQWPDSFFSPKNAEDSKIARFRSYADPAIHCDCEQSPEGGRVYVGGCQHRLLQVLSRSSVIVVPCQHAGLAEEARRYTDGHPQRLPSGRLSASARPSSHAPLA
jgi:hypothetical protein